MDEIRDLEEIDESEVQLVIEQVLELEQRMLHIERPRGIMDDIEKMIKNIVREQ